VTIRGLARAVLLVLVTVGLMAVAGLVLVGLLAVGTVWALGRLVGGFADTVRTIERELYS